MSIFVYLIVGVVIGCCAGAGVYNMITEWKERH